MIGNHTPPAGLEKGFLVPEFRFIEPTPSKASITTTPEQLVSYSSSSSYFALSLSHRVLYRGSLSFASSNADIPLEGVCFVAHFDSASPSRSALLSSSLPLALESQRGRAALSIISEIPTASFEDRFDDSIDLRMYIHPQSLITRAYFERLLCMDDIIRSDGRTSSCIRVRLGDEQDDSDDILIYGQILPELLGTSSDRSLPKLCIRVARILPPPPKARAAPRPDDPLPRSARFPGIQQPPSNAQQSHPSTVFLSQPQRKQRRAEKVPQRGVPGIGTTASDNGRPPQRPSITTTHAKSFRVGTSNGAGMIGQIKGHIRQKSSLSVVSTMHGDGGRDDSGEMEEEDVFGTSSDHDAELAAAGRKRPAGLFDAPAKTKSPKIVGVTTEEDSLQRSNKDVIKRQAISLLSQRGVLKDHEDFKELYQIIIRGAAFALRGLMGERRIEREEARTMVLAHLDMYLPDLDTVAFDSDIT